MGASSCFIADLKHLEGAYLQAFYIKHNEMVWKLQGMFDRIGNELPDLLNLLI